VGVPGFRVHDLRHTAASVWLGAGADPKVVQRVLGHATAAMTMDLYGHMVDANLWQAAQLVGDTSGTFEPPGAVIEMMTARSSAEMPGSGRFSGGAAYRNRTDDLRITRRITFVHSCLPLTSGPGYALVPGR
jgi:Phage integrase family